jgi:hypothetical protein
LENNNFFPGEKKIDMGKEKNPILLSNISLEAIYGCEALAEHLKSKGISSVGKIKANQKENEDLVKGYCESKETRLELLKLGTIEYEPKNSIYCFHIELKPLLWAPDRCEKCNKFKHLHGETACEVEICGKCMGEGHNGKSCKVHFSRFKCINCGESRHSSFDRIRCKEYEKWETEATAKEMQRLRDELGNKKSLRTTDPFAKSYASATSVNDDIAAIKRQLDNAEKQNKINLESNNTILLDSFKMLITGKTLDNKINNKLKEFRSDLNAEIDHKLNVRDAKLENKIISLLKTGNFNGLTPKKVPESKDFDQYFEEKYAEDSEDKELMDDDPEASA